MNWKKSENDEVARDENEQRTKYYTNKLPEVVGKDFYNKQQANGCSRD